MSNQENIVNALNLFLEVQGIPAEQFALRQCRFIGGGDVYSTILKMISVEVTNLNVFELKKILYMAQYTGVYGCPEVNVNTPEAVLGAAENEQGKPENEQAYKYHIEPVEIRNLRKLLLREMQRYGNDIAIKTVQVFDESLCVSLKDAVNLRPLVSSVNVSSVLEYLQYNLEFNPVVLARFVEEAQKAARVIQSEGYEHKVVSADGHTVLKGVAHIKGILIAGAANHQRQIRRVCLNNLDINVKVATLIHDYGIRANEAFEIIKMFQSKA